MNFDKIQTQDTAINNIWFYRVVQLLDTNGTEEHKIIEALTNWLSVAYIPNHEDKTVTRIVDNHEFSILLKRTETYYLKLQFIPNKPFIDFYISDGGRTNHSFISVYTAYKIVSHAFRVHSIYTSFDNVDLSHNDIIDDMCCEIVKKLKKQSIFTITCKYAFTVKSIRTLYKLLKIPNISFYFWKEFDERVIRIFDVNAQKNIKKYTHIKVEQVSHALYKIEYKK